MNICLVFVAIVVVVSSTSVADSYFKNADQDPTSTKYADLFIFVYFVPDSGDAVGQTEQMESAGTFSSPFLHPDKENGKKIW